jgi:hypothetical protein
VCVYCFCVGGCQLRGWEAYKDLKRRIEDLQVKLPLFASLAKPSIRERHWEMIREKTGSDVSPADPELSLGHVRRGVGHPGVVGGGWVCGCVGGGGLLMGGLVRLLAAWLAPGAQCSPCCCLRIGRVGWVVANSSQPLRCSRGAWPWGRPW